ncbi:MAG TPA: PPC domain-containing DNA-binding protein [Phycisphaerae bacterium]|nr:PPC domain-containing DNA-binding protein [Phycisphaerae bacterium]
MRAQRVGGKGAETTYLLVFETGDEVTTALREFAVREGLQTCRFTAIGAVSDLVLGYFEVDRREYKRMPVVEQAEVVMLAGNITEADGQPRVHAHVVIARADGTALGGHLLEAHVRPTLELFLTAWPARVQRRLDEASGLMLIDLR